MHDIKKIVSAVFEIKGKKSRNVSNLAIFSIFDPVSPEPDFCQTCGFHQKKGIINLYQHVQYLKKQMKTFPDIVEKLHFDPR